MKKLIYLVILLSGCSGLQFRFSEGDCVLLGEDSIVQVVGYCNPHRGKYGKIPSDLENNWEYEVKNDLDKYYKFDMDYLDKFPKTQCR